MTPLCTLVAATLLAGQPPLPLKPADPSPQDRPVRGTTPRPPEFRAAGVDATVGEMRLEQQRVARLVVEKVMRRRNTGLFTDADLHTTIADIQRCADIEKSLAQLDGERVEAILNQLLLLSELEDYFQARADSGMVKAEVCLLVRFHRLGARASLLEEVKADPAVVRRHRANQVAVSKSLDAAFAKRAEGGILTEEDMLARAEGANSEVTSAATRGATPAERDAANRRAVESLKEAEKYFAQRSGRGLMKATTVDFVTSLRLDAELREVSAAEKPAADRVRQLREEQRDALRRVVKLEAGRRDGGLLTEADADQFRKAQGYLVEAELALAGDAKARRVVLARNLEEAVSHEDYCAKRVQGGTLGDSVQYRSIRERIEAEIRLKLAK